MTTVVLVGTLDTKRDEHTWLRERLHAAGVETRLIDVGTFSDGGGIADIGSDEVAAAAGTDVETLRGADDRGAAIAAMSEGAAAVVSRLYSAGELHAVLAIGGSGGSSVASRAMQALPVGVPKLLVTTMAAGDVSPYVGATDVTIMPSVVDVAGINRISREVLSNAVAAAAAMARGFEERAAAERSDEAHLIGATMFGLTTPAVDEARARLSELGYEVLVFHATGAGGRAMETLVRDGFLDGVLDLTTTELVDDLLGGVLSAGPDRLQAAGAAGLPQVVSVGALDMCNFGPEATVPERYAGRSFVVHNPTVTLMRTTAEEMAELGTRIATRLRAASGPVEVHLPLRGVSGIDVEGGPFHDPEADAACFAAIRAGLAGSDVAVREVDLAVNDPGFGTGAADALHELIRSAR
ncbi:Tm-1-like ATP-binding domain-containing protein [Georgenia sp. Z1491]|uniref:Tm-1-like ATP-binding domain-containing protein n=1 Tax=Georgenia sp. Z1491 TaxID=3416707 RepID=UPI003CECBCB3